MSAQLASSHLFPLPGATSPQVDVFIPLRRVTLLSHGAMTSSMPPLHFQATFHPVPSPLEPKLKL
jgi:hypothetical protein